MNRQVIAIVLSVFALVCTVQANAAKVKPPKKLEVEVSLQPRLGEIASTGSAGLVVIDTITINRVQPEVSGDPVTIAPELADTQLGFATFAGKRPSGYQIVLKGSKLDDLVRESVSLGFNNAG